MKLSQSIVPEKTEIKNIIFDWGGVITNIDFSATKNAFRQLGLSIFDEKLLHNTSDDIFVPFEIGMISAGEFRNRIRNLSDTPLTDQMINSAWCAMLGDLPLERWNLLEQVGKQYKTYVLSNTNAIHVPYYFERLRQVYGTYGYVHLFENTYFSHELKMRKPNADIFNYVLADASIAAHETLFIDDFIENIETAHHLGFHTVHITNGITILDVFE